MSQTHSGNPAGQLALPISPGGVTRRHCGECRTDFIPYSRARGYQKYCSHACRQAAWTAEQAGKRPSKAKRILERLREGPADTMELARVGGIRFSARILELRQDGHRIVTEEHGDYATYRLEE